MGDQDSGEKTEEPTPHKLREARKKGQIPKSKEITSAILIIVSFQTFRVTAKYMWENIVNVLHHVYEFIPMEFSYSLVGGILFEVTYIFVITLAPMFAATFISALIVESMQTQFMASTESIKPKLEKLNPIEGMKKFFSLKQYVELLKSLVKMAVVIWLIVGVIKKEFIIVMIAQELTLWQVMSFTGSLVMKVIMKISIFYVVIAILDYMYQNYEFIKSMRMSKKEIKDEYKKLEGDPTVKQRQREAQRQMSQSRQMGAVPGADVVVTNPVHLAIAVEYKPNKMPAPIILAKGKRLVAQEIKRIAEENNVPIVESPPLARRLYKEAEVNSYVPAEYYKAVAEILAFVYNLKRKKKRRY